MAVTAAAGLILAGCGGGDSSNNASGSSGGGNCDKEFNSAVLDARPVPAELKPEQAVPPIETITVKASDFGSSEDLSPQWWNTIKITPEEAKQVCEKGLSAVYMDWDSVLYNQTVRQGAIDAFEALGIKLLRVTNYALNGNGLKGDLDAVLPLNPDIIVTGGPIDPAQFGPIMKPAVDKGIQILSYGTGAQGWGLGTGKEMTALLSYDTYTAGKQLAAAVHDAYPDGTTLGYIHWINNIPAIHSREQGLLDGVKEYSNIKVVADGAPDPAGNRGYNDPNAAQAYTEAFLQKHPEVEVLFAPWEDPPALGEIAAIKAVKRPVEVVTMDLGTQGADQIAKDGPITVDMAPDAYDVGRTEAIAAGLAAIGKDVHGFLIVPTIAATQANLKTAWEFSHGPKFPCNC
jgi:ribose transport system substrate-binding protein